VPKIRPPLFGNENNENHLKASHNVSRDEVESILFGLDEEPAIYQIRRVADAYEIFGVTPGAGDT
jgi:hypothetical protein